MSAPVITIYTWQCATFGDWHFSFELFGRTFEGSDFASEQSAIDWAKCDARQAVRERG